MVLQQKNYDPAIMQGASKNINLDLGDILDANENEILEFDAVASAQNYLRLANAATADPIILSVQGTADRGLEFHNDQGEEILILGVVATAVNQLTITNAATGNPVLLSNDGEDDIGFEFHAKNGEQILILTAVAAAVNELGIANAAAGAEPSITATGGDTDIHIDVTPKGTGNIRATLGDFEIPAQILTADSSTVNVYGSTALDSTSNKVDCTLGSGTFIGQTKTIVMTNSSNASDVSITNHQTTDPEIALFDAVDETGVFLWSGTEWVTIFATCTFV